MERSPQINTTPHVSMICVSAWRIQIVCVISYLHMLWSVQRKESISYGDPLLYAVSQYFDMNMWTRVPILSEQVLPSVCRGQKP
jgi:hypothetical protein